MFTFLTVPRRMKIHKLPTCLASKNENPQGLRHLGNSKRTYCTRTYAACCKVNARALIYTE